MSTTLFETLEATDASPAASIVNVLVSSELMENYIAGRSYSAEHPIAVAYDLNDEPMLFTIGSTNAFSVIMRQQNTPTGWQQIDLSASLGADRVAQQFGVLQLSDGNIILALAMESRSQTGASELYVTRALSNDPTATNWADFGSQWQSRPSSQPDATITQITISTDIDTQAPLLFVATKQAGKDGAHWIVRDTSTNDNFWRSYALPTNLSDIIDMAFGSHPLGQGMYTLYHNSGSVILEFSTLDQSYTVGLTPPSQAKKLAILANADNLSDLYVAGDGLYVFKAGNQLSGAHPEPVAAGQLFPRTQDLIVCQDAQNIAIWARTADTNLLYTTGRKADQIAWSQPVVLRAGVAQIAPLRSQTRMTNQIFLVGTDNQTLGYLLQDPTTTLWKETDIALPDTQKIIHFNSYVSHARLTDVDNMPVTDRDVAITASEWVYVTINGSDYGLDTSRPITLKPDMQGMITITNKISSISSPIFHLTLGSSQVIDINPTDTVKAKLSTVKQADDWLNQRTQSGRPLLKQDYDQSTRDSAAKAVQQLIGMASTLPSGGLPTRQPMALAFDDAPAVPSRNTINISHLPDGHCWGVHLGGGSPQFLDAATVQQIISPQHAENGLAVLSDWGGDPFAQAVSVIGGDILETLEYGLEQAKSFFVRVDDEIAEFFIDLGNRIVKFALECVEQVFKVINWVLKELLGIDLQTLIDWLGFLFNWDDILSTHKALRAMTTLSFNHMLQQTSVLESKIRDAFTTVRQQVVGGSLPNDKSAAIFNTRTKQSMVGQDTNHMSSPQSTWAHQSLSNNLKSASVDALDTAVQLSEVLINALKTEGAIIENAMREVSNDIIANLDQLSFGEIMDRLAKVIVEALLNSVENVALSFVEVAEVLAKAMWKILTARWDIPLITPLYENVIAPGSTLSLLDLACLVSAIPATITYKLINDNKAPFNKADAQAYEAAQSWGDLLRLMGVARPAGPARMVLSDADNGASLTQSEKALAITQSVLGIIMGGTRLGAGISYTLVEAFDMLSNDPIKRKCQKVKFAFDCVTYALSFTNATIYATTREMTPRRDIDIALQYGQLLMRLKDAALLVSETYKTQLSWFETVFGGISLVLVCVSTGLQAQEDPSLGTPPISQADADALLAMKGVQNISASIYQILSGPKQSVDDKRVKTAIIATRVFIAGLVVPAFSVARASKNLALNRQFLDI